MSFRKIIPVLVIVFASLFLTSCEREGIYKPAKKLSKIYYLYPSNELEFQVTFNWDGDKLQAIDNNAANKKYLIYYDGNQIDSIAITKSVFLSEYYKFRYDEHHRKLIAIDRYVVDIDAEWKTRSHCEFHRSPKGLITETILEIYRCYKLNDLQDDFFILKLFVPEIPNSIFESISKEAVNDKGELLWDRYVTTYTYDHDNVIASETVMGDDYFKTYQQYSYTNIQNPYYHLDYYDFFADKLKTNKYMLKQTLITSIEYPTHVEDGYILHESILYDYDEEDGFPTRITKGGTYWYENVFLTDTMDITPTTNYYEYE